MRIEFDLELEKYAARKHWDICLHEAAHAVMDTRSGYRVDSVTVVTKPGDLADGFSYCILEDGKPIPPVSSCVAGNLAVRLWGVGKYHPVGRMMSQASGDLENVAQRECGRRGGERISDADRKAAMKVWQAEDRKLKSRIMRDPTFELQIKSVAKALSLRGTLDGDEVRRAMGEALGVRCNPDVPVADSAASYGGAAGNIAGPAETVLDPASGGGS